jgi:hypothetical protein
MPSYSSQEIPDDVKEGIAVDRQNLASIEGKQEDLDQRLDQVGRLSKEEQLDNLMAEARRLGIV